MENIHAILKKYGIEIPTESKADFDKDVAANYKTQSEFEKKLSKVEGERDNYKEQLDTATETLKGFEGVDIETMKTQLKDWQTKAENAEKDYQSKLEARDFEDALKTAMEGYKFTSEAAKKAVMSEVKGAGLKLKDGKILGLGDLMETIKTADASAFVDEGNPPAKFTQRMGKQDGNPAGGNLTKADIMSIKDRAERRAAIANNIHLFNGGN